MDEASDETDMVVARVNWLRERLSWWLVAGVGGMSGEAWLVSWSK
jgi:hypothetical protein